MKNVIIKVFTRKKGISHIMTCVLILFSIMLIAISVQYANIYHVAQDQKNVVKLKIDSYITECAINNYNALKQGESWGNYIDRDELVQRVHLILSQHQEAIDKKYTMTEPVVHALEGDNFGVIVEYELGIPFKVLEYTIEINVPIKILSNYTELRS